MGKLTANIFSIFICVLLFTSCKKNKTLFTNLAPSATGIHFTNEVKDKDGFGILYYLYFYNGGGVATGDVNNDGLTDIFFTANHKGGNKLYLNKGNFKFEDITETAAVAGVADWSSGVTMADVNADGLLDIYVSTISNCFNLKGANELFINKGNGKFTEEAAKYNLNTSSFTTQSVFFDYDHDGDLDCFILNQSHQPHANIIDTVNRHKYDSLSGDRLYRNDVKLTGKFTDVSATAGIYQSSLGYGLGVAVADLNNDGWEDIYVGNDFHENDYYYLNNGAADSTAVTFTEAGAKHFKHYSRFSMGNDIADYNNDGQLDVITADMLPPDEKTLKTYGSDENPDIYKLKLERNGFQNQYSKNNLQTNNGNGVSFSENALLSGVAATDWSWAPLFADFDNDGFKDLFISSGIVKRPVDLDYIRFVSDLSLKNNKEQTTKYDQLAVDNMPDGSSHPFFFKNNGGLQFTDVSKEWGTEKLKGYFNGAAYADLDNDGNLDMVINSLNAPAVILKNNTTAKQSLSLSFKGNTGNTFGIGAKAWVFTKDKTQYQQLMLTRGFQSSCEARLHFGLGTLKTVDSILIVWPNQHFQLLKNVTDKSLIINQAAAKPGFIYTQFFPSAKKYLENKTDEFAIKWKHQENDFLDYNKQYLIPHQLSTLGPKMAVADINMDGLEDVYVCGASLQPGVFLIQNDKGNFTERLNNTVGKIKAGEETDALFFDANSDGFPDLYICMGGNQFDDNNPALADELYINDGKGNFSLTVNKLPAILKNKSCVVTADIDKDGDLDLFVGGLADARKYGMAQPSYLLLNDGKGNFAVADSGIINLNNVGMVTSAVYTDVDNDGWPDLAIAGEWMSLKIYKNQKGKFIKNRITASSGLWQTIYAADINNDGFMDLLAGNWGHNTKLFSGKNGPLKLYVKDFDNNGSVEQIMAYTIDGKEYSFLAKDELERSLPVLKKAYLKYSEVAGKTVQYMFYDLFRDYTELKAETLSSAYFINDGKGNFTIKYLPDALQLAPVFSFVNQSQNKHKGFFAAGNFYGVTPYEGRYDALLPTFFYFDSTEKIIKVSTILEMDEEVRDAKWVKHGDKKPLLIYARNNAPLLIYKAVDE